MNENEIREKKEAVIAGLTEIMRHTPLSKSRKVSLSSMR